MCTVLYSSQNGVFLPSTISKDEQEIRLIAILNLFCGQTEKRETLTVILDQEEG